MLLFYSFVFVSILGFYFFLLGENMCIKSIKNIPTIAIIKNTPPCICPFVKAPSFEKPMYARPIANKIERAMLQITAFLSIW